MGPARGGLSESARAYSGDGLSSLYGDNGPGLMLGLRCGLILCCGMNCSFISNSALVSSNLYCKFLEYVRGHVYDGRAPASNRGT